MNRFTASLLVSEVKSYRELDAEAHSSFQSLVELNNNEKDRLKLAFEGRLAAEKERVRQLKENPPREEKHRAQILANGPGQASWSNHQARHDPMRINGNFKRLLVISAALAIATPALAVQDANGNGMSDVWERHYNADSLFSGTIPAHAAAADPDGDGWTNANEAVAGTNPFRGQIPDGGVVTNFTSHPSAEGLFVISWPSAAGKVYKLKVSPDLLSWADFGELIAGTEARTAMPIRSGPPRNTLSGWSGPELSSRRPSSPSATASCCPMAPRRTLPRRNWKRPQRANPSRSTISRWRTGTPTSRDHPPYGFTIEDELLIAHSLFLSGFSKITTAIYGSHIRTR